MSKTALLAQNDNLAIDQLKQKVGRSVFDLSHTTTFPIDVNGAILPICCIETVPSDSFEISCECLLRQLTPLVVPLMTSLRLNTAWYWCDNRLAWKKWERFMTGGRSGNETYDIPRMYNVGDIPGVGEEQSKFDLEDTTATSGVKGLNGNRSNTLHTYFGISLNKDSSSTLADNSDELPLAFPFFDYQMICRDFYTDVDRLEEDPVSDNGFYDYDDIDSDWCYKTLFPSDDDDIRLADGVQINAGINNHKGFLLDKVRYHNVRDDYFTTSKKAPMRGDVPEISIGNPKATIDFDKALAEPNNYLSSHFVGFMRDGNNKGLYIANNIFHDTFSTGSDQTDYAEPNSTTYWTEEYRNVFLNTLNKAAIKISDVKKINASELRLLSQLTVWQELNMLHKPYYNDFLNAHFDNVKVGESPVEKPQFIGGTSQVININSLEQTAATSSAPLGRQGAFAQSLANNYVGKFYCNNYGYLIGVAYIIPDMMYEPAMPRGFSRRTKEDYYSPEFANLSMQATLNKEIFYSNDDDWNNTPWGYTGCFDELRSIPNKVAGEMLNSSYTDLKAWTLRRAMSNDNKPSMSTKWLSLKDNVDKTAWSNTSMPAFILQCANFVKSVRPLPYVAIPKAL